MTRVTPRSATIAVRNVGGIEACELTFSPGVTILTGRNATGRTSLLSALAGALGGSAARLKTDTERGHVELELGEETCRRTYRRTDDRVSVDGTGLADAELVDRFACLLESNPARRAVERGDDLRPIIMAPVDTDEIESAIESCEAELATVTDRLSEIDRKVERLPALRERADELRTERTALAEDLERAEAAVEASDDDAELAEAAQELLDALDSHRDQRSRLVEKRRTQRQSIDALEDEREELLAQIDEHTSPDEALAGVAASIEELQSRERSLARTVEELTTIVEFNADLLSGSVPAALAGAEDRALATDDDLCCWTCGNAVDEPALSDHLDELRVVIDRKRSERRGVEDRLDTLRERRQELSERQRTYEELLDRREEIEAELARRRKRAASIEEQIDAVDDEIADLESEAEDAALEDGDALDRYQELTELEYRRGRLESELDDVTAEIDRLEDLDDDRAELERRREALAGDQERLRTHIVDRERDAVETFNDHVADVLDLLDYENIDRVWIERTVDDADPARAESFDLHVVRSGPEGRYEDTVDTLSESEREVIGLLVALPGYLIHDVHDTVPFVLLDSLEAIDADRIAALVDYFADHAPYLVVALLPEDAAALDGEYDRIPASEIGA